MAIGRPGSTRSKTGAVSQLGPTAVLVRAHLDRRGPAPVPRRELVDQLVAGEVEIDRRHADLALAERGDVGARLGIAGHSGTADPVVGLAVWVAPLDGMIAIVALAEGG